MSFASGTTFVGYTVQRPLSSDEMGDLYLAQHPRLPHWNALKVLSATLTEDREFRDRFMRETPIANGPYHVSPPYPSGDDAVRLPGTRRDASATIEIPAVAARPGSAETQRQVSERESL
jgi:hypothetical protein